MVISSGVSTKKKAVFFLSQAAARQFIRQGTGGKIINVASMLSYQGGIRVASYTASKSAILGLTRIMACELLTRTGAPIRGLLERLRQSDTSAEDRCLLAMAFGRVGDAERGRADAAVALSRRVMNRLLTVLLLLLLGCGGGGGGGKGPGQRESAPAKRVPDTVPGRRAQCVGADTSSGKEG